MAGSCWRICFFAGGESTTNIVDAYNTALTRSAPTPLSVARWGLAGASVGGYALFAGGSGSSSVNAYNTSLTRSSPTSLSKSGHGLTGVSAEGYAFFAGGRSYSTVVDMYDVSLTRSIPVALSQGRYDLAAATSGDYALFAGGWTGQNYTSIVDAYKNSVAEIYIYPQSRYKFQIHDTEQFTATGLTLTVTPSITGYIKFPKKLTGYYG